MSRIGVTGFDLQGVNVPVDIFDKLSKSVRRQLETGSPGHMTKALKQWGAIYRSFIKERFSTYSRGGGDWAPLLPGTIAKRRKGRGVGAIANPLYDTGTLIAGTNPSLDESAGAIEEHVKYGIRLGYGGPQKHPSAKHGQTIAEIASYHQTGAGPRRYDQKAGTHATQSLPARPIIVEPPSRVLALMARVTERAMQAEFRKAS